MCGLTKYGIRELAIATLLAALLAAAATWAALHVHPAFAAALGPVAAVWLWVLWFFRDPVRRPPEGDGLFLSPADGTVTDLTPLGAESALGREGLQVGVFMSVFSVHVNRSPCEGRVESVAHQPGVFLDARDPHAGERNESATIRLAHERGGREYPIVFRQVAGLIARRIVTDLAPGQTLARGERIGMIKFGSRMELLLPRELAGEVRVKVGQKVYAGRTVLLAAAPAGEEAGKGRHGSVE